VTGNRDAEALPVGRTDVPASQTVGAWRPRLAALGVAVMVVAALYHATLSSMVAIWWRSETFAHGFIILPVSLFLVWRLRGTLRNIPLGTEFRALPVLLVLGMLWAAANIAHVLVLQQLAVVAMIPTLVWLITGTRATMAMLFPLGFLFFMVPMGEALIPPMMDFTAQFTVTALRLSGIPVFWEGTYFTIPSGNWSVVEGCSGVRYLIASITLGVLFSYLMYRNVWRRLAFVFLALIFPVIANGLRAYMIVMIAHLSDMRLALGIDHLIYGWVFFGVVMFVMFWLGSLWRERDDSVAVPRMRATNRGSISEPNHRLLYAVISGVFLVTMWPLSAAWLKSRDTLGARPDLELPAEHGVWSRTTASLTAWKPRYINPTVELQQTYTDGAYRVGIYMAYYGVQQQDEELVNSQNVLVVQKHPVWHMPEQYLRVERIGSAKETVYESQLESRQQNLLVWHWYYMSGHRVTNPYEAKAREVLARLSGSQQGGAAIIVYTTMADDPKPARAVMRRYLDDMEPVLESAIDIGGAGRHTP